MHSGWYGDEFPFIIFNRRQDVAGKMHSTAERRSTGAVYAEPVSQAIRTLPRLA
jgi:hypothetical protein